MALVELHFTTDSCGLVPKIDWRNSSSQMYFRKQGGLTLQTWVLPSVSENVQNYRFGKGFCGFSVKSEVVDDMWVFCILYPPEDSRSRLTDVVHGGGIILYRCSSEGHPRW